MVLAVAAVLLWLTVLFGVEASPSPFVRDFLSRAEVVLFDREFTLVLPLVRTQLVVHRVDCSHFELGDMDLSYTQSQGAYFPSLRLNFTEMRCTLHAIASSTNKEEEEEEEDGQIIVNLRNTFSSAMLSIDTQTWPQEITTRECYTDFQFDSPHALEIVGFLGRHPYAERFAEEAFDALAGKVHSLDKLVCASLRHTMSLVDFAWHAWQRITAAPRVVVWPNVRLLESFVKPASKNSSLVGAPYTDSLAIELASSMVNDLLGVPSAKKTKPWIRTAAPLVINKLIRDRLGGKSIMIDGDRIKFLFGSNSVTIRVLNVPIQLQVDRIRIDNLDTFRKLDVLRATSKLTLEHVLEMQDGPAAAAVGLALDLSVNHGALDISLSGFQLSGLKLAVKTLLAVDSDLALNITTEPKHLVGCLLTALRAVQVPKLEYKFAKLVWPNLTSLADDKLAHYVRSFVQGVVWPLMPTRDQIQHLLVLLAWEASPVLSLLVQRYNHCPAPTLSAANCTAEFMSGDRRYVEWHEQLGWMDGLINTVLASPADDVDFSVSRLAEIAADVLSVRGTTGAKHRRSGGVLVREQQLLHAGPGSLLGLFPTLPANSTASIWISNLHLGPLNDIHSVGLLLLEEETTGLWGPFAMSNAVAMNSKKLFGVEFELRLALTGLLDDGSEMHPHVRVRMDLSHVNATVASLLELAVLPPPPCLQLRHLISSCAFGLLGERVNPMADLRVLFENAHVQLTCLQQQHGHGGGSAPAKCERAFTQQFIDKLADNGPALQDFLLNSMMPRALAVMSGQHVEYFDGFNVTLAMERFIAHQQHECTAPATTITPDDDPAKEKSKGEDGDGVRWIPPMRYVMLISAVLSLLSFAFYLRRATQQHLVLQTNQHVRLMTTPLLHAVLNGSNNGAEEEEEAAATTTSNQQEDEDANQPPKIIMEPRSSSSSLGVVAVANNGGSPRPVPGHISLLMASASPTRREDALYLIGHNTSLFEHPGLNALVRYGVLAALFVNFVIFVAGNFFTMGAISVKMQVGGQEFRELPMMTLTLDACIDMMINARALLFALFIGGCSGIFPWIRVALLAFCWLAQPTVLPPADREQLLERMELLGKFSLAQVYLFTVLMTVINVDMQLPGRDATLNQFLLAHTYVAYVECVPKWGLFLFLVATWLSFALNHLLVHLHKSAVRTDSCAIGSWRRRNKSMPHRLELSSLVRAMVIVAWPACLLLALSLHTLHIDFLGFSGFGINLMQPAGHRGEGVTVSLGSIFPRMLSSDPAGLVHPFGRFLMMLGYALFILVAPMLHCALSVLVCALPGEWWDRRIKRYYVLNALRLLHAWSTLEVLGLTLVVVSLQLHKFFKAMSSDISFLPEWIGTVLAWFGASEEQAVGFGVRPTLRPWGVLFVVLTVLVSYVGHYQVRTALLTAEDAKEETVALVQQQQQQAADGTEGSSECHSASGEGEEEEEDSTSVTVQ